MPKGPQPVILRKESEPHIFNPYGELLGESKTLPSYLNCHPKWPNGLTGSNVIETLKSPETRGYTGTRYIRKSGCP